MVPDVNPAQGVVNHYPGWPLAGGDGRPDPLAVSVDDNQIVRAHARDVGPIASGVPNHTPGVTQRFSALRLGGGRGGIGQVRVKVADA